MNRRFIRINSLHDVSAVQNALSHFFEATESQDHHESYAVLIPIDMIENDLSYIVTAVLPGTTEDDIVIRLDDETLTIDAELAAPNTDDKHYNQLLNERRYGKFTRQIQLPRTVDVENVSATYTNGLLTLELPKAPESLPRTIAVRSRNSSSN